MLSKFKFIQIKEELSHLRADIVLTVTKKIGNGTGLVHIANIDRGK